MKIADKAILCELNILKNRLEAGESVIQCLQSMGVPLTGPEEFLRKWEKLSFLMLEGRILPAKAVGEFTQGIESKIRLLQLAKQKTLSPRIQSYLSAGIVYFLIFSSTLFFPQSIKPDFFILGLCIALSSLSVYCMYKLLKNFESKLCFLDWINFLKSISLSLECGMTFPVALVENLPSEAHLQKWPQNLRDKVSLLYLESELQNSSFNNRSDLWALAEKSWNTLCRNYQHGLPQVGILRKLADLQEEEFKNWLTQKSDHLSYLLLIPLFTLSVPAILILLFAPLLSALN